MFVRPELITVDHLSGTPRKAPVTLSTNLRLGWKGLSGTNTLAYYKHSLIVVVKSFITLTPGCLLHNSPNSWSLGKCNDPYY
jgi:hypothetical protein